MSTLGKQKTFKPSDAPAGIDSDTPETEEEVFDEAKEDEAKVEKGGLFHKEGVEPRQYNLEESVQ